MAIFGEASSTAIAGFILTVVSFLIQFIGFVTPYWAYISSDDSDDTTNYYGLWLRCKLKKGASECKSISCDDENACSGSFIAARYMASLNFIILLAAVVILALKMFVIKDKPILRSVGVSCCFIAGTFGLITTIAFAAQHGLDAEYLNFSFSFCVIAAAGSYLSGSLVAVGK